LHRVEKVLSIFIVIIIEIAARGWHPRRSTTHVIFSFSQG
jgi:hypothetical protein